MQKVTVLLDEQGVPAMGELVTKAIVESICYNFNQLFAKGFVIPEVTFEEPDDVKYFFSETGQASLISKPNPYPIIRLIPQTSHGVKMVIRMAG